MACEIGWRLIRESQLSAVAIDVKLVALNDDQGGRLKGWRRNPRRSVNYDEIRG
jgi:hypothetical protein